MKNTKQQNKFAELVAQINELTDKEYKALIKCTRQQRRATRTLMGELTRQKRETLPRRSKNTNTSIEGMNYELAQ